MGTAGGRVFQGGSLGRGEEGMHLAEATQKSTGLSATRSLTQACGSGDSLPSRASKAPCPQNTTLFSNPNCSGRDALFLFYFPGQSIALSGLWNEGKGGRSGQMCVCVCTFDVEVKELDRGVGNSAKGTRL